MAEIEKIQPFGTEQYNFKDIKAIRTYTRAEVGNAPNYDNPGFNGLFEIRGSSETPDATGTKPYDSGWYPCLTAKVEHVMLQIAGGGTSYYIRGKQGAGVTMADTAWNRIVLNSGTWGISITGNAATATALTSNAGSSTQPIYFSSGKPISTSYSLSSSVNSGTKYLMPRYNANTTIGSSGVCQVDNIAYPTVTPNYTSGGEQFYKAWLKYVCNNYPNADLHICTINPNSKGPCIGNIYDVTDKNSTTGLPRYSTFIFHNLAGNLETFGTHDYTYWHRNILTDNNYTSYTVTKTGSGASGTWGINITGSAGSVAWGNVTGKPGSFTPASHTHDGRYLRYEGWWTSGSGQNIDNAQGMTFTYADHGAPGSWGITCTFDYQYNSNYKTQFHVAGYNCIPYVRSRSSDRGGWTGWKRMWCQGDAITSAVWNDYAEMRNIPEANSTDGVIEGNRIVLQAGRCVREVGDGTMVITTKRLERGCKIISDTFGFLIGETDNCKTPIAVSGRALVYIYEGRDEAASHIGWPVCSGPDGTVSIMTEEEEEKYPSRIVGTISEIPDYDTWGTGNVSVDGRIWIYVR